MAGSPIKTALNDCGYWRASQNVGVLRGGFSSHLLRWTWPKATKCGMLRSLQSVDKLRQTVVFVYFYFQFLRALRPLFVRLLRKVAVDHCPDRMSAWPRCFLTSRMDS